MTVVIRDRLQPSERRWYKIDYSNFLNVDDLVTSVLVTVEPVTVPAMVIYETGVEVGGKATLFRTGGGEDGKVYKFTVVASTAQGEIVEDEVEISVVDL